MLSRILRSCRLLFPVALVLCTVASRAQAASTTRIEETDPSITYSGDWYKNGGTPNSAGSALLTNALGARAAITFTGTAITWLGVADPWSGVARVYLDGTLNTVNTYGPATQYQRRLFTARGLAPGPHTLSIEVMHVRDVNGNGSWIWFEGFEIENGEGVKGGITASTGRIEQNNAALIYAGTWFPNTNPVQSGGSAVLAVDAGSSVTVSFNGASMMWLAYWDEWSGIARVYLDGVLKATVDAYLLPSQAQIFNLAIGDGEVPMNPTMGLSVSSSAVPPGEKRVMSGPDVQRAVKVLRLQERLIFRLATIEGMRPGEIFGLQFQDFGGRSVRVSRRVYRGDVDSPKTGRSREVALSTATSSLLSGWILLLAD